MNEASVVRQRYKASSEYWKPQRDLEKLDLEFMLPENQWTPEAIKMRQANTAHGTGARPRMSVSKIEQPIQLVQNQFQNSHLGVNIHPLSANAQKDTAEVLQGLYRKIERDSNADQPRGWAFARAIQAGWGAYLVTTAYDDDALDAFTEQDQAEIDAGSKDPELLAKRDAQFDQKITIERILYQDQVILDPSAQKADFSDGKFAFLTSWVTLTDFKEQYPEAKISKISEPSLLEAALDDIPEWVKDKGEQRAVLVASYWCKQTTYKDISITVGGETLKRKKPDTAIKFSKWAPGGSDGIEPIEEADWNGHHIPIIPVLGKEMQPYNSTRTWIGIVRPAMDSQRMYNYAITTAVEVAALEPKAPFFGATGVFSGHEAKWNSLNTIPWTYVEYNQTDVNNQPATAPQRMPIDSSRLSVSLALMDKADAAIQATTYTPDPALGKHSRDESGKAIEALQGQSEASTSNYVYGMAQVSMPYEAVVILDMIPLVYDRPGRLARILDLQDEEKEVILNAPFVMNQEGRPQAVPEQGPNVIQGRFGSPMTTSGAAPMPQAEPKHYDLTAGRYGVTVSIGKSYKSRFEQGRDQMTELLAADPSLMPILGDLYFKYNDAPWANEASERMKKLVNQQHPELNKAEEGQETPDQLRGIIEGQKKQLEQGAQMMQQMKQELDTKQAEQQAKIETAKIAAQSDAQTSQSDGMLKIALEKFQAEADERLQAMKDQAEKDRQESEQHFEAMMKQAEQKFALMQSERDREHEDRMKSKDAEIAESQAEQAAAHQEIASDREAEREGDE